MNELPFLIFDEDACLQNSYGTAWIFPMIPEDAPEEAGKLFLRSLRSGDRKRFLEFCAEPMPQETDDRYVSCEIFSTSGLPVFRYAFCEKNVSGGRRFNTVHLAEDAGQFRHLMSPAALAYSRTTERIVREILLLADEPDPSSIAVNPGSILALRLFPTVLRSVMEPKRSTGLCDVFRITETIVQNLRENPLFLHTELRFSPGKTDPSLRIIELSADLYVHILTSLLTALMTVSADHTITLDVQPFAVFFGNAPLAVDVTVSTVVRDPFRYRNDSGSLRALSSPDSVNDTLLSVSYVLACLAGIMTSVRVDYSTQVLSVCLTVNPEEGRQIPGFKYRDPYRSAGTVIAEFLDFYHSL